MLKDKAFKLNTFLDHHIGKGSKYKDWSRAYNTWLTNAAKFENYNAEDNKPLMQTITALVNGVQTDIQGFDCGNVFVTLEGKKLTKQTPTQNEQVQRPSNDVDVMSILKNRSAS